MTESCTSNQKGRNHGGTNLKLGGLGKVPPLLNDVVPVHVTEQQPELANDVVFGEAVEVKHLHHHRRIQEGRLGNLGRGRSKADVQSAFPDLDELFDQSGLATMAQRSGLSETVNIVRVAVVVANPFLFDWIISSRACYHSSTIYPGTVKLNRHRIFNFILGGHAEATVPTWNLNCSLKMGSSVFLNTLVSQVRVLSGRM